MSQHFCFTGANRLHGKKDFDRVFQQRWRKKVEVLTVFFRHNRLEHNRLGLSVSRKIGNAVKRNRVKRLIREAFRLSQNDWSKGYDMVVIVSPHKLRSLEEYRKMLNKSFVYADKNTMSKT